MSNNEKVIPYDIEGVPIEFLVTGLLNQVSLPVAGFSANNADSVITVTTGAILANSVGFLFNGANFDRQRNNTNETLLASAARTAAVNSADFVNYNAKGAQFIIDISATPATPEITVTIQGKDPISGNYYDLLIGPVYNSVGTNILKIYPGIVASPNASASDILPRDYRVSVANADADSITYSIAAALVL